MKKIEIQTDQLCEEASIITEIICRARGIELNESDGGDYDDCLVYTDKAQDIFNYWLDELDEWYSNNPKYDRI